MRYPDRAAYRSAWDGAEVLTPPFPLNLDLELSRSCNLRCSFCYLSDPMLESKSTMMDYAMACDLLYEADGMGIPAVKLNWRGEPTIHPQFTDILSAAAGYGFHDVLVNTNGQRPDVGKALGECATEVIVSLDSLDAGDYAKTRRGGNIFKVFDTIDALVTERERGSGVVVVVQRVISHENQSMSEEVFLAKTHERWGESTKVRQHFSFDRSKDEVLPRAARRYCGQPSRRLVVSAEGRYYPCCPDYRETMCIGEYGKQSLDHAWTMMEPLRARLKSGELPSLSCKDCRSWTAYDSLERDRLV